MSDVSGAGLEAVVFDFDYTLADSSAGCVDCVRTAQARMGLPPSAPEAIRRTIGLSVPATLATLNGVTDPGRAAQFGRLFLARADEVMADNTVVYDAVPGVLEALRSLGVACAIASTKYRYRIEMILEREALRAAVDVVIGAEDVPEHKPDPACLHAALRQLGVPADRALYVGDSLPDAEAAARAEVTFVAVLTGTTAADAFAPWAPGVVLDSIADLPAWLGDGNCKEMPHG